MFAARFILFTLFLLLIGCGDNSSSQMEHGTWEIDTDWIEKGPVKARLKLKQKSLSILDNQLMVLEIQGQPDADIETPSLEERLGDYTQTPWRANTYDKTESLQTIKKYYSLQRMESGEQVIPSIEVAFYQGSGNQQTEGSLKIPAQYFTFTPLEDLSLIERDLEQPTGLVELKPFPWKIVLLYGLGAIVLTLAMIFLCVFLGKKEKVVKVAPPLPAHILAWRELEALVERQKSGELSGEVFVSELSDVLRRYIERRFELRAPELTTEEFLNVLLKDGGELKHQQEVLKQFLEFTDLVKFANQKVKEEDVEKGFDFIKTFIQQSKLEGPA